MSVATSDSSSAYVKYITSFCFLPLKSYYETELRTYPIVNPVDGVKRKNPPLGRWTFKLLYFKNISSYFFNSSSNQEKNSPSLNRSIPSMNSYIASVNSKPSNAPESVGVTGW